MGSRLRSRPAALVALAAVVSMGMIAAWIWPDPRGLVQLI